MNSRWLTLIFIFAAVIVLSVPARGGGVPDSPSTIEDDSRELERVLALLGYFVEDPDDEDREEGAGNGSDSDELSHDGLGKALVAFQKTHDLTPSGELDDDTLNHLGGPSTVLLNTPRVKAYVQEGDTLESLAERFSVDRAVLARYNSHLSSPEDFIEGVSIIVPLVVPAPKELSLERAQVCREHFVGTYHSQVSINDVERVVRSYGNLLIESGMDVDLQEAPVNSVTFHSDGLAGRFLFNRQASDGSTRFDLVVFRNADQPADSEFEASEC